MGEALVKTFRTHVPAPFHLFHLRHFAMQAVERLYDGIHFLRSRTGLEGEEHDMP
jgi:hypothetical protein